MWHPPVLALAVVSCRSTNMRPFDLHASVLVRNNIWWTPWGMFVCMCRFMFVRRDVDRERDSASCVWVCECAVGDLFTPSFSDIIVLQWSIRLGGQITAVALRQRQHTRPQSLDKHITHTHIHTNIYQGLRAVNSGVAMSDLGSASAYEHQAKSNHRQAFTYPGALLETLCMFSQ